MFEKSGERFLHRLEAKPEGSVVHRDHEACIERLERTQGLLWIHVHISAGRGVVGSDREQGDIDFSFALRRNFSEPLEPRAVTAVKDRPSTVLD